MGQTQDIDFYGPLPTGQYILVILDCYSRFPEVEVLSSISAKTVIPKLDVVFARHGVPSQVVSDNGPPFQGHEFNRYMTKMRIQHNTSTPLLPQGNAEVEAYVHEAARQGYSNGGPRRTALETRALQVLVGVSVYLPPPPPIRPQRYHLLSCYITEKFAGSCPHFPTTAKSLTNIEKPSKMTKNKSKGENDMQTLDGIHEQVNYQLEIVFW
ncbi:PREDICTED: uncharacterized protein K02A2.6-like [Paramuricea clavata]|uniref:PREDICTED: uncharacterized protein K02A2.6-like n=1 Tax=Paramuricea clavata TaxID=317549 RepID=A0A6S7FPJ5_PARCT|nr:PREDICTED: uncharacterized protein K02A2.6-like [Paramuricea clavata]